MELDCKPAPEPSRLQVEARGAALEWNGSKAGGFMVQMRSRARRDPAWLPSSAQAAAILKFRAFQPVSVRTSQRGRRGKSRA
jgi:hypothetical protein